MLVRSVSEFYGGDRPFFNITLPPTSLYNCEDTTDDDDDGPDLTALYVLLVVAMVAFIILAILCLIRQGGGTYQKTRVFEENRPLDF